MASRLVLACLAALLCVSLASFPKDWTKLRSAFFHETVTFSIALHQRNVDQLTQIALEVNDPDSPRYGKHLTQKEVMSLIAPPQDHVDAVTAWLQSFPGVAFQFYGDGFRVTAPVSALTKMFSARFYRFKHTRGREAIRQEGGMVIPAHVAPYIAMVTSLTAFPIISQARPGPEEESGGDRNRRPLPPNIKFNSAVSIKQAYNLPVNLKATNPNTVQVAMEFYPEGAVNIFDIQSYAIRSGVIWTNISKVVGPWVQGLDNGESTLDVELLTGIGSGVQNWYWTVKDGWAYEMATDLFTNTPNPKIVVSVSYGWPEVLTCQASITHAQCNGGTSQQYVARSETELSKLAAIGMTVVICTQDEGAPSEANMECRDKAMPVYSIYPGSSQWVTAVSATTIAPNPNGAPGPLPQDPSPICQMGLECDIDQYEYPCETNNTQYQWTTGGGFSSYVPRPAYQSAAVAAYLATRAKGVLMPPPNLFPFANRGYADVSAVGDRILIWQMGFIGVSAGTSASTPIFAAVVALLNDYRLNSGKAPLGFLNPLLYKMAMASPGTFNDVIYGDNRCTRSNTCCQYGYGATNGWDPVTGLGSPNFGNMLNFIKTLP